ncbi:hypothetical protein KUTeg_007166 [Tegillarca granosa]|uniref:RING-type domain-containing protein n=1 Tax=Tegillarca granosa TaxID=220873 RepID=A0ABQ9FEF2_TEGGR|nr:hypothetical protein KUTeg_007166 [Tegillarca granosa]
MPFQTLLLLDEATSTRQDDVQIVFLPCRHACCCVQCAFAMNKCPICRKNIIGGVRICLEPFTQKHTHRDINLCVFLTVILMLMNKVFIYFINFPFLLLLYNLLLVEKVFLKERIFANKCLEFTIIYKTNNLQQSVNEK